VRGRTKRQAKSASVSLTTLARKTTSATGKLKAKRQKAKREIYLTSSEIQLRHPEYTRWKRPEEDRVRLEGFVLSLPQRFCILTFLLPSTGAFDTIEA
jgi:hypothetical protein